VYLIPAIQVPFCTDNRGVPCFLGFLPKFVPRFPL
jgi:hypothetical protein